MRRLLLVLALAALGAGLAGCGNLIGAGGGLSCAVLPDGTPNCFGANGAGQAGRAPSPTAPPGVVALPKGYGVADLSVGPGGADGQTTVCAAVGRAGSSGGEVRCWGSDVFGQLGRGSAGAPSATPVVVNLGENRTASNVAVGGSFACAIAGSDGVSCWGLNTIGELGTSTPGIAGPAIVAGTESIDGGQGVTLLAAGHGHACSGISSKIICWGLGTSGQLGNGANADSVTPVAVTLPSSVDTVGQLALGTDATCMVASDRAGARLQRIWCWGGNGSGQLGDGTTTPANVPVKVAVPKGQEASLVSVGANHACGLMKDSTVWCWGGNESGQLGNGTTTGSPTPVQVPGVKATLIAAGAGQTCASTTAGRLVCWGLNAQGQVGTAPGDIAVSPRTVPGIAGLRAPTPKAVRIKGAREVGARLTATTGAWPYAEKYSYTWSRSCGDRPWQEIKGAKAKTLRVGARLAGCSLRVSVQGENAWTQAAVVAVAYRDSPIAVIAG